MVKKLNIILTVKFLQRAIKSRIKNMENIFLIMATKESKKNVFITMISCEENFLYNMKMEL